MTITLNYCVRDTFQFYRIDRRQFFCDSRKFYILFLIVRNIYSCSWCNRFFFKDAFPISVNGLFSKRKFLCATTLGYLFVNRCRSMQIVTNRYKRVFVVICNSFTCGRVPFLLFPLPFSSFFFFSISFHERVNSFRIKSRGSYRASEPPFRFLSYPYRSLFPRAASRYILSTASVLTMILNNTMRPTLPAFVECPKNSARIVRRRKHREFVSHRVCLRSKSRTESKK